MRTDVVRLKGLFQNSVHLVVPKFQRQYLWTKENWKPLWEDVERLVRRERAVARQHFLGAIVLEQRPSRRADTDEYIIVDGQQRLTTLQLFLAAAREVARTTGIDAATVTRADRLCLNEDMGFGDNREVLKVWPTRGDFKEFHLVMTAPRAAANKLDAARSTIFGAYEYFVSRLTTWAAAAEDAPARQDAFARLVDVFYADLQLVVVKLGPEDNPQAIFESLNGTGLPLQASDLVRNYVFRVAEEQEPPLDAEDLYDRHWARFDDGNWRELTKRGKVELPHMDAFLTDFLWLEQRDQVRPDEIFVNFRDYIDDEVGASSTLNEVMSKLEDYGEVYHSLEWPQPDELTAYETAFLRRLRVLEITTLMPVLLHIMVPLSPQLREPVLRHLDSYLWRRAFLQLPADYDTLLKELVKILDEAGDEPGPAVEAFLAGQSSRANFWPSDADMRAAVMAPIDVIKGPRLRHLLAVIDAGLQGPTSELYNIDPMLLTLEHLLPQHWKSGDWPLAEGASRSRRDKLIHTLGNLTLLTRRLNSEVGNGPWAGKRAAILASSRLNLNLVLPTAWDEEAIEQRGRQAVELLIAAFPRPATTATVAESPESVDEAEDGADDDTTPEVIIAAPTSGVPVTAPPSYADHIKEALETPGAPPVMTVSQLARAETSQFRGTANAKTIRNRLKQNNVGGVAATTDAQGHLAAKLAPKRPGSLAAASSRLQAQKVKQSAPARRLATRIVEACSEAKALGEPQKEVVAKVNHLGSVPAVRQRLAQAVPAALLGLARVDRLDLAVESIIQLPEFAPLFTPDELARAAQRLAAARASVATA